MSLKMQLWSAVRTEKSPQVFFSCSFGVWNNSEAQIKYLIDLFSCLVKFNTRQSCSLQGIHQMSDWNQIPKKQVILVRQHYLISAAAKEATGTGSRRGHNCQPGPDEKPRLTGRNGRRVRGGPGTGHSPAKHTHTQWCMQRWDRRSAPMGFSQARTPVYIFCLLLVCWFVCVSSEM